MTDKQTSRGDKGQSSHKQTTRSVCPLNHSTLLSHDPSCPSSLPRPPCLTTSQPLPLAVNSFCKSSPHSILWGTGTRRHVVFDEYDRGLCPTIWTAALCFMRRKGVKINRTWLTFLDCARTWTWTVRGLEWVKVYCVMCKQGETDD